MAYVIGVDGGGTKTTCLFSDDESALSNSLSNPFIITGKGTNPQVIGFPEMQNRLKALIREGLETFSIKPEEITAVCCGLAGVGRREDEKKAMKALKEMALPLGLHANCSFSVHSDTYIALRGALPPEAPEGILVISGTGSNAIGMAPGNRIFKSGGWGHLIGDEGSGYQIGIQGLNSITRAYDKRGKETALTSLILAELEMDHPKQLISYIYNNQLEKKDIARFARFVIEAAADGDSVSRKILTNAAEELANHVASLYLKSTAFNENTPITTTGSLFTYSELLRTQFIQKINQNKSGTFREAYSTPVHGAAVIAREIQQIPKK